MNHGEGGRTFSISYDLRTSSLPNNQNARPFWTALSTKSELRCAARRGLHSPATVGSDLQQARQLVVVAGDVADAADRWLACESGKAANRAPAAAEQDRYGRRRQSSRASDALAGAPSQSPTSNLSDRSAHSNTSARSNNESARGVGASHNCNRKPDNQVIDATCVGVCRRGRAALLVSRPIAERPMSAE